MHCFDCTQTHSIVAYSIEQGVPVKIWTNLFKKICSRPKNFIELVFSGFSHITARRRFEILLFCSDFAQTYRIVAHFVLEGGKTKLSYKTVVVSYLTLQKFQGLAGVDFRSVKF